MSEWYFLMSQLFGWLNGPITDITRQLNMPIVTAFLLGVLGSTSPCQLSTNTSAVAMVTKDGFDKKSNLTIAFAYIMGKVLTYLAIGGMVVFLGANLRTASLPVIVFVRKLIGPVLVVIGLYLLGLFKIPLPSFIKVTGRRGLAGRKNKFLSAIGMGGIFALAFCPTLYLLFFGVVLPLSVKTRGGIFFPGVFALGTSIPLIIFVLLFTAGSKLLAGKFIHRLTALNKYMRFVAGVLFLLTGLNEIIIYFIP